jgi:hypothetical protein
MIDHNVMRFHISVHDALAMAVVESLEQLKNIVPDIDIVEFGIQTSEVGIIDVFED